MLLGSQDSSPGIKLVAWDLDKTIFATHIHNWLTEEINQQRTTYENALEHFKTHKLSKDLFLEFKEQAKLMLEIGASGLKQGIVSFTDFPEIIRPTLKYLLTEYMMEDLFPESNLANTLTDEMLSRLDDSSAEHAYQETLEKIQGMVDNIVDELFVMGGYPTKTGGPTVRAKLADRNDFCGKAQHLMAFRKHCSLNQDPKEFKAKEVLLIDDDGHNISIARTFGYQAILATSYGSHFALIRKELNLPLPEATCVLQENHPPLEVSSCLNQSLEEVGLLDSSDSPALKRKALSRSSDEGYFPCYNALSTSLRKLALSQEFMPLRALTFSAPLVSCNPGSAKNKRLCNSQ